MNDLNDVKKRLEALAATLSGRDGFHLGMHNNPNAVELEYGQMLYGAVLDRRPDVVCEIGTGPGYSASWILLALEKNDRGHLWTMDIIPHTPEVWEQIECPSERLTALIKPCRPLPDEIPEKIEILFHDGSHDWFNDIVHDFDVYLPRIPVGGIVLLHDVVFREHMGEQAQLYFGARESEWKFQEVSMGCGMLIAERIAAPAEATAPKKSGRTKRVRS